MLLGGFRLLPRTSSSAAISHTVMVAVCAQLSTVRSYSSPCVAPTASAGSSISGGGGMDVKLYQYEVCPFSNQVKAFLDFNGVVYSKIEVNPFTKSEIKFASPVKKTPVAVINGETVVDSKLIIARVAELLLEERVRGQAAGAAPSAVSNATVATNLAHSSGGRFLPETDIESLRAAAALSATSMPPSAQPNGQVSPSAAQEWAQWSDKTLSVLMYPNINSTPVGSWQCFAYADEVKAWGWGARVAVRVLGPMFMFLASKGIKKKYNIKDEKEEVLAAVKHWTDQLKQASSEKQHLFFAGERVSVPDLLVFGVLRSIAGMPTHDMLMTENRMLRSWYEAIEAEIQHRCA